MFTTLLLPNRKSYGPEMLRVCSPPFMCHRSRITCHVSLKCYIYIYMIFIYFLAKWYSQSLESLLSTGGYPVQFIYLQYNEYLFLQNLNKMYIYFLFSEQMFVPPPPREKKSDDSPVALCPSSSLLSYFKIKFSLLEKIPKNVFNTHRDLFKGMI